MDDSQQKLLQNLIEQVITTRHELERQDSEDKRLWQQIDKVYGGVKTQRAEDSERVKERFMGLDARLAQIEGSLQNLAAKSVEREAQLSLLKWIAGGGLSAGGLALVKQLLS